MKLSFTTRPDEAITWYHEHGYFIEESVFTPEECDRLIKLGLELPAVKGGNYRPVMHPHRLDSRFLDTMRDPRLVGIMWRLVGGKPSGLQTEFFYGKPGVTGFSRHQDNFFVEAPADSFASAWIALVDVPVEKGALTGFPGSHKLGKLPVSKLSIGPVEDQDPNANNEESILPPEYKPIDLVVSKGSVVFLHSYFVHASRVNATKEFRYVLLCTYIRQGASFRAGQYAKREAIAI